MMTKKRKQPEILELARLPPKLKLRAFTQRSSLRRCLRARGRI